MSAETRRLQQTIHAACRELGLDSAARHDVQMAACGKASMRDMDDLDLAMVLVHLKARGWDARKGRRAAPRADLRFVHVLWARLGQAGVLDRPDRDGLNAFVRRRFADKWGAIPADIDMLRDPAQINAVIRALKEWCARAGVVIEGGR